MQVWNVLHAARWKYRTQKIAKSRHLGAIAQLCRVVFSQRHVSTICKNLLNSKTSSTRPHNTVNFGPLMAENGSRVWGTCKFQRVSRLGSLTARHSGSERQPNFAASTRGHHLYSAERPSRWELAHIVVVEYFVDSTVVLACKMERTALNVESFGYLFCIRSVLP